VHRFLGAGAAEIQNRHLQVLQQLHDLFFQGKAGVIAGNGDDPSGLRRFSGR
jgi:hypothetical protein